jgi:hypothetical protein
MSWIEDIRLELKELDSSPKSLRKFGFLIGGIVLVISFWLSLRYFSPFICYSLGIIGVVLIVTGVFSPQGLKGIHKLWMGMAFAIGWVVSTILLTMIFYLVIMPVGLLARILGKEFLDKNMRIRNDSYWIKKDIGKKANYEKMY